MDGGGYEPVAVSDRRGKQGVGDVRDEQSRRHHYSVLRDESVFFNIKVDIEGKIAELQTMESEFSLVKCTERKIEDEIKTTFEAGVDMGEDVLNLMDNFYRKNVKEWKRLKEKKVIASERCPAVD